MPDITVFKMDIDDSTFNAPFGGRSQSNGSSSSDGSSGLNVKLVAGLGGVFLLTGGALVFVLKRRFGSDADEEDDERASTDFSETDNDDENGDEDENRDDQESDGIRAIIGLSFLIATTAVVKRKIRTGGKDPSVAI